MSLSAHQALNVKRVLLWADLHLREEAPAECDAFAESLEQHSKIGDAVVILGDLFDAYWGPKQWAQPFYSQLAQTFQKLAVSGIPIWLVRGNRDVLARTSDFDSWTVCDGLTFDSTDGICLMTHGDEYCLADIHYQRLRRILRNPFLASVLRRLPPPVQRAMAKRLRQVSQETVPKKALDACALHEPAVEIALQNCGANRAIMGHLHAPELRSLPNNCNMQVLPAWSPGDSPLILDGSASGNGRIS
ncbi:MAG: UDP-2,3-diacylglucosamine diphosphatase [Planctomycetes bacterium]|nr:UDP-2,3-diacylglucosamine diphosphatase [Planctomycetota bacterium]MBT4028514.1 UDP-2,3-diacylglucosamine diphosphatase [Planctomycetota bacterium]MBT4559406.1 UDP-2,3-diacylglucosamine diphosphatase [Planctomycetota bacterium]MBT5101961.1 UDP-2,3-diacylglucosamine diphosphatase [Planctomycetota bacterium]MBT7012480.1 UDP-2,3-diacylglucosamine diphosphatase [Planctomycetota bacterium]